MHRTPLGRILKQHRRAAGLTQERLAQQMGYHSSRISRMESGEEYPTAEFIESFMQALELAETQSTVLRTLHAKAKPSPDSSNGDGLSQNVTLKLPSAWFDLPAHEPLPTHSYYPLPEHEAVLEKLLEWLQSPTERPVICIEGVGGLGKTTLALEVAERLKRGDAFQVLYVSAEYLRSPARASSPGRRLTFEMVLDRLATQMGLADATNHTIAEKEQLLAAFFQHDAYLIVLDNLEDSENEFGIVRRLSELLKPSRLLVTTRNRTLDLLDFVRPVHLKGLSQQDSAAYLRAEGGRLELALVSELEQRHLDEVHHLTFGVPYALKRLIGQAQTWSLETALDNLRRAAEPGDQKFFNYLFEKDWNALEAGAQRIWLLMGRMIPTTISLAQFRGLKQVGPGFHHGLVKLVSSNLIETGPGATDRTKRYGLHPLARLFLEHLPKLVVLDNAQAEFYRLGCVLAAAKLWLDVGAAEPEIVRFDAERENILHAARETFAANEYQLTIDLWERYSTPLYNMGYWTEYRQLDLLTLSAARALKNPIVEAEVCSELGWVAMERGDVQEAEAYVSAALEMFIAQQNPLWVLITRRYLATIHMVRNQYQLARRELIDLLADIERDLRHDPAIPERALARQTAVIHNGLGSVLRELGDYEGSERELALGMEDARWRNPSTEAISLLNLGKLKLMQTRLTEARSFLEQCLALCSKYSLKSIAAGAVELLAHVTALEGNRQAALEFAHDAQTMYQLLGAAASERQVAQFIASL